MSNESQFYKLSDELVVATINFLALSTVSPSESLKVLNNLRMVDTKLNNVTQDEVVIKSLLMYWSKRLGLPPAYLGLRWLKIESEQAKTWFGKCLLKLINKMPAESLNKKNINQENALMIALSKDEDKIANFLLDKNIDFDDKDNLGQTALIRASLKNKRDIVRKLLERGFINIDAKDVNGKSALVHAFENSNCRVFFLLKSYRAYDLDIDYERTNNFYISMYVVVLGLGMGFMQAICWSVIILKYMDYI